MKYLSDRMTSASGSIGGTTFSHNKGGLYTRARRVPTDPATAGQIEVRNILSNLISLFRTALDDGQRTAWATFAANTTVLDALGSTIRLDGPNWYVRFNSTRLQAGLDRVDDAPTIFALTTLTTPEVTLTASGTNASVAFTDTDEWANADGGALLIYVSRPQNSTKNFFKGPYRFAARLDGNGTTPPTTPATITLPFPSGPVGSSQFFRFVATAADGRDSGPVRLRGLVP